MNKIIDRVKCKRFYLMLRNFSSETKNAKEQLDNIIKKTKIVVFMKGIPEQPRCGFSDAVVRILREYGAPYDAYDVLQDESLRQNIKEYSDWPTIPQIYINGEFIGGCDILLQMHQDGELIKKLKEAGISTTFREENKSS